MTFSPVSEWRRAIAAIVMFTIIYTGGCPVMQDEHGVVQTQMWFRYDTR